MNHYRKQLGRWRADHSTGVVPPKRSGATKTRFLSEGCPAGLLSTSADFAKAYIVVAEMTDMLANIVCSSCNIVVHFVHDF